MNFIQYMVIYILSMTAFTALGYLVCRYLCRSKSDSYDDSLRLRDLREQHTHSAKTSAIPTQTPNIPQALILKLDTAIGLELDTLAAAYFPEIVRSGRTDDQFRKELFRACTTRSYHR